MSKKNAIEYLNREIEAMCEIMHMYEKENFEDDYDSVAQEASFSFCNREAEYEYKGICLKYGEEDVELVVRENWKTEYQELASPFMFKAPDVYVGFEVGERELQLDEKVVEIMERYGVEERELDTYVSRGFAYDNRSYDMMVWGISLEDLVKLLDEEEEV